MIDTQYTKTPFYGVRKMMKQLNRNGYDVGKKLIARLMHEMGIEAVYPKPNFSKNNTNHRIYPYLLSGVKISTINHVWSTDITYIQLEQGFAYLVAILDWYSRYVLAWKLSNSLELEFCTDCLEEALDQYEHPQIFNTDQGSQFTSKEFTGILKNNTIQISMDGRGRVFDNIFVERLWRTVKYENVYLKGYQTIPQAQEGLADYFHFYNTERIHQSLDYQTPQEVFVG